MGRLDLSKDLYFILPQGLCTECPLAFPRIPRLHAKNEHSWPVSVRAQQGHALCSCAAYSSCCNLGGLGALGPPHRISAFHPARSSSGCTPVRSLPSTPLSPYCYSCPRPLPLLVLTVIFRYPLPSPPLLIYLLGEMKTISNCYWWLCNTDKSCHPF